MAFIKIDNDERDLETEKLANDSQPKVEQKRKLN